MPELIVFIISLLAVIFGADWLGNSAIHLAKRLYLPRILIGATFVSIATTLPEIVIGSFSAIENQVALGIGTVFGSPITNIGLVLGIVFLFSNTKMQEAYFVRNVQIFLTTLAVVFLISAFGVIGKIFGVLLILFGAAYLLLESIISKHEESLLGELEHRFERLKDYFTNGDNYGQIFFLLSGALLLFVGAYFLIMSATALATTLGIPQIVVGTLVIAFGTSLPEIVTSINSIIRRREDLGVGNLFGASILDLTIALGLISVLGNAAIDRPSLYLITTTAALLSIFSLVPVFGKLQPKIAGLVLICTYMGFLVWFTQIEL